jgi:hypothetical protein
MPASFVFFIVTGVFAHLLRKTDTCNSIFCATARGNEKMLYREPENSTTKGAAA